MKSKMKHPLKSYNIIPKRDQQDLHLEHLLINGIDPNPWMLKNQVRRMVDFKQKLPTQLELASLAASLPTGLPFERVKGALEIWELAECVLPPEPLSQSPQRPHSQSLNHWLLTLMPKAKVPDRMRLWRSFLRHEESSNLDYELVHYNASEKEIAEATNDLMEMLVEQKIKRQREDGILGTPDYLEELGSKFHTWNKDRAVEEKAKATSKGGIKKAENAKAKKLLGIDKKLLGASEKPQKGHKQDSTPAKQDLAPTKQKKARLKQVE